MGAVKKISKLTEKYQTTVPLEIRKILKLHQGDSVVFEVQDKQTVVIRKATQSDRDWLAAVQDTLSEWNSTQDEVAYGDL